LERRIPVERVRDWLVHLPYAAVAAIILTAVGGYSLLLSAIVSFMVVDWYIAFVERFITHEEWHWEKTLIGLLKGLGYLGLIHVAHRIDQLIHALGFVRNGYMFCLLGAEVASIHRHAKACGMVFPDWLCALAQRLASSALCRVTKNEKEGGE
jgi:toxin secretion/phage lysis holin